MSKEFVISRLVNILATTNNNAQYRTMTDRKRNDCTSLYTICLSDVNNETVEKFQSITKSKEKKASFTKSQAINRIIGEWAEDHQMTLEVNKKL